MKADVGIKTVSRQFSEIWHHTLWLEQQQKSRGKGKFLQNTGSYTINYMRTHPKKSIETTYMRIISTPKTRFTQDWLWHPVKLYNKMGNSVKSDRMSGFLAELHSHSGLQYVSWSWKLISTDEVSSLPLFVSSVWCIIWFGLMNSSSAS